MVQRMIGKALVFFNDHHDVNPFYEMGAHNDFVDQSICLCFKCIGEK